MYRDHFPPGITSAIAVDPLVGQPPSFEHIVTDLSSHDFVPSSLEFREP
jgi:hypothetical protein